MTLIVPGKFVYYATPRTASVATEAWLSKTLSNTGIKHFITKDHHATPGHASIRKYCTGDEEAVTTVRDPFEIMLSWFCLSGRTGYSDFIANYHHTHMFRGGSLFWVIHDWEGYHEELTVMRHEHLHQHLQELLSDTDLVECDRAIPIMNKTKHKPKTDVFYTAFPEFFRLTWPKVFADCLL